METQTRPQITAEVTNGVCRLLYHHQMSCLTELRLGNGRRLDVLALGPRGNCGQSKSNLRSRISGLTRNGKAILIIVTAFSLPCRWIFRAI